MKGLLHVVELIEGGLLQNCHRSTRYLVAMLCLCSLSCRLVLAQAPADAAKKKPAGATKKEDDEKRPLYAQDPFDLITLDDANKNEVLKVIVIDFPNRVVPSSPPSENLAVRLPSRPGQQFSVAWKNVKRIDLFEHLLLREANRLTAEGQLDEAFGFYNVLRQQYPNTPGLVQSIQDYLYADAGKLFKEGRFSEAMAVLEELNRTNPNYKRPTGQTVFQLVSAVSEKLVNSYIDRNDFRSARLLIERLGRDYGKQGLPALVAVSSRLKLLATVKKEEAEAHLQGQRLKQAQLAAREMDNTWPTLPGAAELQAEIFRQYPVVIVGVAQPVQVPDVSRIDNWASRRSGRLMQRTLLEFAGAGPEGGRYTSPLGVVEKSEDRLKLIFRVDNNLPGVSGFMVARRLLALADPSSAEYSPSWAAIAHTVQVQNVNMVEVELRHPHVLPEPFLQIPIERPVMGAGAAELRATDQVPIASPSSTRSVLGGQYVMGVQDESRIEFVASERGTFHGPAEIIERHYPENQRAIGALRRGEIDVIDQLFPADAARLIGEAASDKSIIVKAYASPTLHMLIPNPKNPFLANQTFRRALIYSIDREKILNQELLGSKKINGFRTISGPFPASMSENDSLSYAYDDRLKPWPWDPRLGKLFVIVSLKELEEVAKKRKETPPVLKELVLAYPAHETARVASHAIAAHLKVVGVNVKLNEFPPGVTDDPKKEFDLLYTEVAVTEPLADAKRLFGEDGIAPAQSPYVRSKLHEVEQSLSWREVYQRFQELHSASFNDITVLPLWQTVDHFAYQSRIQGIEDRPVTLYQNIHAWQLTPPSHQPNP